MPTTVRSSARRRRKNPDEKLPERPGESSAQVMAPTRMKLRVRRRDNATGGAGAAGGQPVEEEERGREGRSSSRRKNSNNTVTAAAATSSSSPPPSSSPPTSSSSTAARAVMAAEEASPDSKCPICLDRFNNLAYLDRCLHRFCFPCIQEWSHNKAECPLCKQPFASILHSVRAEDDFKEYTLRPAPANSNVAATVAMVAAMASAARSDHQMRLMLRRHRGADGVETSTRRQRRERGGRGRGGGRAGERTGVWEWYLDSPPLALPPHPHQPAVAEDSEDGDDLEEQSVRGGADLAERGVIFEGLTGLGGAGASMAPNDRASRRLMTRLAARQRLQREGGTVRRLRERETVAFRRALYRSSTRVRGVAGVGNQGQQQRDITAESFRRNPVHLNRLRPWLRRELTVLYGAHGSLVDIVQRIIMARLARHGLEDTPTIEDELRPFLLARTDHFLHELVSFARSPLSLENYDLQAVYEPPATALELDGTSSSTDSSSVIAISEGEDEEQQAGGRSEERPLARVSGTYDDLIQTGSSLSLSAWDDETPGPSYSSAEPSCSLGPLSFSPAPQEAANEEGGEKQEDEEGEEECLIVGYKKPIAERTPELVQLSSDTEEDKKEEEEENAAKFPPIPTATPPLSYLPIIPPSTSAAYRHEQDEEPKEKDSEAGRRRSRVRSSSGSSGKSRKSVCTLSPSTPGDAEQQRRETECWRDRKQSAGEAGREKRRRKRSRRGRERSGDRLRKSGTLYNPNRSIYPAMMRQRSPSPFHSSVESAGSPLPPSPADSSWEYHCSQVSPLTSSISSPSSSSPLCSSPQPSSQTPPMPSLSPRERSDAHHGDKPGGKRKYKSRHLDSNDKDPTWRPSSSHWREKRRERREKEKRRTGRDDRRRRERQRRDTRQDSGGDSSRRSREDRSPSVEIIYEGTIVSNATQPPARKRRRKRHRMTPHSSSPVIITLDSDSSHKNNSSGSSTPLSSQQTVDFSDLPPLALVHSAGVGRVLNAEIGELPVDILDRGSDGSETESVGRSESVGPIAIDNSDNSDHDVDVENVEEGGSLLRLVEDKGPMRDAVVGGSQPTGESDAAPKTKRDSEVLTSDSRLLASILNDLKGIGAQKRGLSLNFGSNCSSDAGNKHFRGQCEVSQGHSNQSDDRSAETRHPDLPERRRSNESRDQNQGFVLPTLRTSAAPLPPLEWLKDCRVREEAKDVPPLLKQASPVRLFTRNTPPPLKHKDAGSPHLLPVSPIDLRSPHTFDADVNSHVDLNSNSNGRPIDSCANDSQAMNALDLKEEPASTSRKSATDMRSSFDVHSTSHRPPIDSHSSCSGPEYSSNADGDFSSSHSSELHSSCDGSKEVSPRPSSSPTDLHHVNSLSTLDVHSAKNKPAHTDSTSRGCRTSCRVSPIDLDPSSSVSTEDTPAGSDVFSGANCNDTSPPVFGAFNDSRTQNSSSSIDSHSSGKTESERFPPSRVCSDPTTAPCSRLLPADIHPRSLKSTVETSEGNKPSSLMNHEDRLPPIDLHHPSLVPPANKPPSTFTIDEHLNHTAFSSSTFQTSHRKSPDESHSKLLQPTDSNPPSSNTHFPIDTTSKHNPPIDSRCDPPIDSRCDPPIDSRCDPPIDSRCDPPIDSRCDPPIDSRCDPPIDSLGDFKLPTDNHITSSPQSAAAAGNQWDSSSSLDAHPESHSAIDEHSASITWSTQTHSSTYDT